MTTLALVKKLQSYSPITLDKTPMVVLPLDVWEDFQDRLEDIEMLSAKKLPRSIQLSRQQIKAGKIVALKDI